MLTVELAMPSLIVQLEVLAGEELLLTRCLPPRRPLRLGPGPSATLPTLAIDEEVCLLEPARGGYRLHLPGGLDGVLSVGGRRIRIENGLLHDPRPEPLLIADGDRGEIELGSGLRARFTVQAQRRDFRALPRIDRGLALALGGSTIVAILGLVIFQDRGGAPEPSSESRLIRRPPALVALQQRLPPLHPTPRATPRLLARSPRTRARGGALAAVATRERILRRLLPARGGKRGVDPLAALEGLLERSRSLAEPRPGSHRPGPETDPLLTGVAGATRLTGTASGLPAGLALPRIGRLVREQPVQAERLRAPGPSREAIRRVVSRGSAGIRLCYERELLATRAPREGLILLRWEIDASGRVTGVTVVKDTIGSASLQRCLREQVESWIFPGCPERCSVSYPFELYARSLGGV